MATKRIDYKKNELEAKKLLKNDLAFAAEVARQWAKKHGYLFLPKEHNAALEKSGGWNMAMQYRAKRAK